MKRKKDHYYFKAREEGYRSRAAYKLKEIAARFKIFKGVQSVLDLCCSPGGWLQVVKEYLGDEGTIIGVDLSEIESINGVIFIKGDIQNEKTIRRILEVTDKVDLVLSDCSPKVSGIWSLDHERQIQLAKASLNIAKRFLREGGSLVLKVFQGAEYECLLDEIRRVFQRVYTTKPSASRKQSAEMYVVAKYFKRKEEPYSSTSLA
ncbi:MAG: RlmE family RNA methyltransferase [Candidatus Freyarchaeota archaeon]|nr:RlmE family RNA methyltransferase [Candidatus Jordarchaeia archaeon]